MIGCNSSSHRVTCVLAVGIAIDRLSRYLKYSYTRCLVNYRHVKLHSLQRVTHHGEFYPLSSVDF